jgi:hypothetical protein
MSGVLAVRKTLVLGLGSTGLQVAEHLAEHLNWQYGSFERAAWVRLLVVETAQPASTLGDRVLWAGMSKEEYLPYITSPRATGATFGFYEWQDGPTLMDIDNPSDGAGNSRLLGRLCLFHPRTYSNLRRRVSEDLAHLQRLTPQAIADDLGDPGLTVTIHEGGTVVYIVGTLCGGTGSGGAADLGYLMDVWSGNSVRRQAIFTAPHPTLGHSLAPRYKKNAWMALKELNHYQLSSTTWSQRLPGADTPYVLPGRPYDILRVVTPAGAAGEDVKSLNAMIAQYLAAAVGPAGFEIAASDVDASAQMVGGENIGFMRPLFSTMGVAALEYPGEHIQRGATCRLMAAALGRWASNGPGGAAGEAPEGGAADVETVLRQLTQGADALAVAPLQQLLSEAKDGEPPRVEDVRKLLREGVGRLTSQGAAPGTEAAPEGGTLVDLVQRGADTLMRGVSPELQRLLERRLFAVDGGPGWVAAQLRSGQESRTGWDAAAARAAAEARQDADSLRAILDRELEEAEQIQKAFMPFGKREKLRQAWERVSQQLFAYLAAETRTQALSHLQRRDLLRQLAERHRNSVAPLLRRLDRMQAAFSQESHALEARWREMAASSPSVNGKAYFDAEPPAARGTLSEEYYKLLRQRRWSEEPPTGWDDEAKERAAMAEVLRTLEPLGAELLREDGQSLFDPRPGAQSAREMIPQNVLSELESGARAFFAPLREQVHIADKASDADLDTVVQASEPRLGVSGAQVSEQLADVKGATPMLSYLAFMDLGPNPASPRPAIARVSQRVRNSMELRRGGITDSGDPYRLLILREKHGFTLGQMEGVVRSNPHDHHSLQSAEGCQDFKFWHTRRDVDWVDPLVPPSQVESVEESWLLAVLLGRADDGALPALPGSPAPAAPEAAPAEGWYHLVDGEFYVRYAAGADTSERGARLPGAFQSAVTKLLTPGYALLRRTLSMRISTYSDTHGPEALVRRVDQCLQALGIFGLSGITKPEAERIVRRAYRRNEALTRAFFEFRTAGVQNPAEFAHLRRFQGDPIEGRAGESYLSDGYYCPRCHHWLGENIQQLRDAQFLCPICNTGERYWP